MSDLIISPMSLDEARAHVEAIRSAAADMGQHLLDLKTREGWRVLGYENWSAFLEGEFSYSRKHLYELMHAAPVLARLLPTGNKISVKAAAALADFDEDLQPAILRTAQARYGALTESNVRRVGAVVQEMALTGHVDIGNGKSTPVDAALDKEDEEAAKRAKQYVQENLEAKEKRIESVFNEAGIGKEVVSKAMQAIQKDMYWHLRKLRIIVYEVE